ncbi:hypothetical protein BDN72DRAFT_905915 [Pluteus cervinus]|uniref:Uncharacterized protein n=1 Tax=Pluteus cervinus TaxID=181527 RepID=A0ACD3A119_9AGAR|nr:hypothetical protein BDN72DRAFT_905915 [Pluteus cervinus]
MSRLDERTLLAFLVPYLECAIEDGKRALFYRLAVILWQDWFPEAPRNKRRLTKELREDMKYAWEFYPAVCTNFVHGAFHWHRDLALEEDRERRVKAWFDAAQRGIFETGPQYERLITDNDRAVWKARWEQKKTEFRREQEFRHQKRRWLALVDGREPDQEPPYYTL